ncbi:hypothetical protein ACQ4LE_008014 [Meloidogyne hapla]
MLTKAQSIESSSPSVTDECSDSDLMSVPSSIISSSYSVGHREAREEVRKLALQVNNVDAFLELIPDLLDYFFSDYRMLVRQKMLEEQCENIRKELIK